MLGWRAVHDSLARISASRSGGEGIEDLAVTDDSAIASVAADILQGLAGSEPKLNRMIRCYLTSRLQTYFDRRRRISPIAVMAVSRSRHEDQQL